MIDVVIAGLGPTGLVLAHLLGMRGHQVVVLEREPQFYGNARAVYTDDECMRIFQSAHVVSELQEKMLLETPIQFVRPDGTVMMQYMPLGRPLGWPVVNFFYQPHLETTLAELLVRYPNIEVRRGRELVDLEQDGEGVTITDQASGATASERGQLRARYLIGADGGRSVVRTKLGIEMTGQSFPEPWLVVDLELKDKAQTLRHLPYFSFVVDPELPTVSCVQPDGFHRFEFRLGPGLTREQMEQPSTVHRLLSKWVDPDAYVVKRQLVYTFNALMAAEWRRQRVLLAGDAAHMTPQFMGQGASSGIRDAANLAWKLDLVLRGISGEALLESYGSERHDHAQAMIDASVLLKNGVSMTHPVGTRLRDLALGLALATPVLNTWLKGGAFKPLPIYTKGRYLGLPRRRRKGPEGTLAPQPEIRRFDGRRVLLDEVLGSDFSLLGRGVDPRQHLSASSRRTLARLGTRFVSLVAYGGRPQGLRDVARATPEGLVEVEDLGGSMLRWFDDSGVGKGAVAVLRPDRFVFAVVRGTELDDVVRELGKQLVLRGDV